MQWTETGAFECRDEAGTIYRVIRLEAPGATLLDKGRQPAVRHTLADGTALGFFPDDPDAFRIPASGVIIRRCT